MGRNDNQLRRAGLRARGLVKLKERITQTELQQLNIKPTYVACECWVTPTERAEIVRYQDRQRAARLRSMGIDERCINSQHDWGEWDCGCSWGCECCHYSQERKRAPCHAKR